MTVSLAPAALLVTDAAAAVPATWGWFDCVRLATDAESAASGFACARCADAMTAKVGIGFVAGVMIGRRAWPTDTFDWEGPFCKGCNKVIGEAEGVQS